jgi:Flp pilus assembly protein TadG
MRRLLRDGSGGVSIIGAFSLVGLIGSMGFVVDAASAYSAKIRNQRVSDMAALSAAQVLNDTGSSSAMDAAARGVAAAAGLSNAIVTTQMSGADQVQVTVRTNEGTYFARIFGATSLGVTGTSVAKFGRIVPACMVALASNVADGILGTGGTRLEAAGCAVAANSRIRATGGSQLRAMSFSTPSGTRVEGGAKIETNPAANQFSSGTVADPLAQNSALQDALSALANGVKPNFPTATGGSDFNPPWYPNAYTHSGYTATWNASTSTFTFPPGNYQISNLNVPGGMKVVFAGPNTSVKVSGTVTVSGGSSLTVGDGTVVFNGGLSASGGTTIALGNGSHSIGSINVGGSGTLTVGDGPLHVNGNVTTAGGSTLSIGKADSHFINGNMSLSGSANLGQGRYSINGNFANNTGGAMQGSNLNIFAKGTLSLGGGANISMSAPTASGNGLFADLLFASLTNAETTFGAGAQNQYKGAIYLPNSVIQMSGGTSVVSGGGCFMLIASQIRLNGGAAAATVCPNIGTGASGVLVALVR